MLLESQPKDEDSGSSLGPKDTGGIPSDPVHRSLRHEVGVYFAFWSAQFKIGYCAEIRWSTSVLLSRPDASPTYLPLTTMQCS